MRTKDIKKKLVLCKKTIANLNSKEMKVVNGGGAYTLAYTNCYMCEKTLTTTTCY